jgi:hypothetical protein
MANLLKFYTRAPFAFAAVFLVLTYTLSYKWSEYLNIIGTISSIGFAILSTGVILLLLTLRFILGKAIPDIKMNIVLLTLQFPFVVGVLLVCASLRSGYS